MTRPAPKGWCPGAHRPMMSGDGLVVRVRPPGGRLGRPAALALCEIAQRFGSGLIDLTNRANLQLRGIAEAEYAATLSALQAADLVPLDDPHESRRNIVVNPFWEPGDLTDRLRCALTEALPTFPDLPAKVGYSIDTGAAPMLRDVSADVRIERLPSGLIVRADGASHGLPVAEAEVVQAVKALAEWLAQNLSERARRMSRVLHETPLPPEWLRAECPAAAPRPVPAQTPLGRVVGVPFGQLEARRLAQVIETSDVTAIRALPWRLMLLEGATGDPGERFITRADDPLHRVDACPGAPFCSSATVETRALARALAQSLAPETPGRVHVSGCAKGCANSGVAEITIVGREGRFDLVRNGRAWDEPARTALSPTQVTQL